MIQQYSYSLFLLTIFHFPFLEARQPRELQKTNYGSTRESNLPSGNRDHHSYSSSREKDNNGQNSKNNKTSKNSSPPPIHANNQPSIMGIIRQRFKNYNQHPQKKNNHNASIQSYHLQSGGGNFISQQNQQINKLSQKTHQTSNTSHNSGAASIDNLLHFIGIQQDGSNPLKNSLSASNINSNRSNSKRGQRPAQQNAPQNQQTQHHVQSFSSQIPTGTSSSNSQRKQTTSNQQRNNPNKNSYSSNQGFNSSQQQLLHFLRQASPSGSPAPTNHGHYRIGDRKSDEKRNPNSKRHNCQQFEGGSQDQSKKQLDLKEREQEECLADILEKFWKENSQFTNIKKYVELLLEVIEKKGKQSEFQLQFVLKRVVIVPFMNAIEQVEAFKEDKQKQLKKENDLQILINQQEQLISQLQSHNQQLSLQNQSFSQIITQIQTLPISSPALDQLLKENIKLKNTTKKQKDFIKQSMAKEEKVSKLLYFIRKEGIDIDQIYKKYVQTPQSLVEEQSQQIDQHEQVIQNQEAEFGGFQNQYIPMDLIEDKFLTFSNQNKKQEHVIFSVENTDA